MNKISDFNLKLVSFGERKFTPYFLTDRPNYVPDYAVIFTNGLVIECEFGMHSYAYGIGSTLIVATEFDLKDVYNEPKYAKSSKSIYKKIKEAVDKNGVITEEDAQMIFSLYKNSVAVSRVKDIYPELYSHIGKVSYINSKANETNSNDLIKVWARDWIRNNGDFIWAVRVFAYMRDKDWWAENSKSEWNKIFQERLGIKLKPINYFTDAQVHSTYGERYVLPDLLIRAGGKHKKDIENVINNFAPVRELAGHEHWYGSGWLENFFSSDIDNEIFYYENLGPKEVRNKVKALESLSEETLITIEDTYSNLTVSIPRSDIKSFSYSTSNNDEAYLNFVAPQDMLLRKLVKKGELVSNYSIDEYSTITIN